MKKFLKYFLITLLVLVAGTAAYLYFTTKKAVNLVLPDFTKINYIAADIFDDTARVNLETVVENKAPYSIDIDSIRYYIRLDTVFLVEGTEHLHLSLPKGKRDTIVLKVKVPIKKVRKTLYTLHPRDSAYIGSDFRIYYNTVFGHIAVDFSKKQKIKVPLPPEVKVVKVEREKIKLFKKESLVNVHLRIVNHSTQVGINLSHLKYTVRLGADITGAGGTDAKISVPPSSSQVVVLPLELKDKRPFKTLMSIIFNKDRLDYEVHLDGLLSTGKMKDTPIELNAYGETEIVK